MSTLRDAGVGLLLGAGWGVLARVWMRLISDDPEFSWAGTLMIIGLAAWGGLCVGVVRAARVRHGSGWWRLAGLPSVAIFVSPGMLFLPAYVAGGWAWGSRRAPRMVRALVLALVLGAWPVMAYAAVATSGQPLFPAALTVVGGFVLLSIPLAWAGGLVLQAWPRRAVASAPAGAVMA